MIRGVKVGDRVRVLNPPRSISTTNETGAHTWNFHDLGPWGEVVGVRRISGHVWVAVCPEDSKDHYGHVFQPRELTRDG